MGPGRNDRGNSRLWISREVENSLRRLQTDHIDLYQLHRPDPATDIEEQLGALTDLVHQGKIRYFGCSTFPAWQIAEAHAASERRGLERFSTEQPPYSIFVRGIELDVLPVAQSSGMGVLVWSPLAGGWLAGRYRKGQETPKDSRAVRIAEQGRPVARRYDMSLPGNQQKLEVVEELANIAEKQQLSMAQLALAFVLEHPGVTSAIIGPRTMQQLEDLLPAADVGCRTRCLTGSTSWFRRERCWSPPTGDGNRPGWHRRRAAEAVDFRRTSHLFASAGPPPGHPRITVHYVGSHPT
jgi:aryl-alcohol dehydrogenase-like predicted oxidoreductase